MSLIPNSNHYALIILLLNDMNKHRTKQEYIMYTNQYTKDLKLLNALLKVTDLFKFEDNLTEVKRICISKVDKDDIDNDFISYPIHSAKERDIMLKWIS